MTTVLPALGGRAWAYIGVALGGAVSIAANVAHSFVDNPEPAVLAVAFSVFWPVALFVTVEIMARVPWPARWRWTLLRFGGLVPVAAVAAIVSYRHLSGLLDHYGEDALTVALGPLAVDGLMLVATGALLATGNPRAQEPVVEPAPVVPETTPEPSKIKPANVEVKLAAVAEQVDPREAARQAYRASVNEGDPLSGAELARRFGKSSRWGLDRVHEVRAEVGKVNGKVPALVRAD